MYAKRRARSSTAERLAHNQLVLGSNPSGPTISEELMNYIELLWELEQKAKVTHKKEKRIKEIEEELKIEEEIKNTQDEIESLKSQEESFLKRKKELENELFEAENHLKTLNQEIDENKFKSSKELKLAKKNQENLELRVEEINRNLGFVNSEIETRKKSIAELQKKINKSKENIDKINEEYRKLEREIKNENEKLKSEFQKKTKEIPFLILHKYHKIREDFPLGAISFVEKGYCGNCGAKVPSEVLEELKNSSGEEIIQCEVCGKILYHSEDLK